MDLLSFNSVLGIKIWNNVVEPLNSMRSVWEAQNKSQTYRFVRHLRVSHMCVWKTAVQETMY